MEVSTQTSQQDRRQLENLRYRQTHKQQISEHNSVQVSCVKCQKQLNHSSFTRHIKLCKGVPKSIKEIQIIEKIETMELTKKQAKDLKYRETHKEEIADKKKVKVQCPKCSKEVNKSSLTRHLKTCNVSDTQQ